MDAGGNGEEGHLKVEPSAADNLALIENLEERIDVQEQMMASMMMAMTEMNSAITAVVTIVLEPLDEEGKKKFQEQMSQRHLEALKVLNHASEEAMASEAPARSDTIVSQAVRKYLAGAGPDE